MVEIKEIRDAMRRLSCIGCTSYRYDPSGRAFGNGPIHYLVEVSDMTFLAWEDSETGTIVANPITRFDLAELDELGAAEMWTVLHVPAVLTDGIRFREIDGAELREAYHRMAGLTANPS